MKSAAERIAYLRGKSRAKVKTWRAAFALRLKREQERLAAAIKRERAKGKGRKSKAPSRTKSNVAMQTRVTDKIIAGPPSPDLETMRDEPLG